MKIINATAYHKGLHLRRNQLLEKNKKCPFCSGSARTVVGEVQNNPKVELLRCARCGAVSVSNNPKASVLKDYYSKYYDKKRLDKVACDDPEKLTDHLFDNIAVNLTSKREINILDFGGGDGTIALSLALKLIRARKRRIKILIVDFDDGIKKSPNKLIQLKRQERLPKKGEFDIVIASAVIEHLPNPKKDLGLLFDLLAKKGIFYARTPYMLPMINLAGSFGVNISFTFPAHLHDLGSFFWNNLFSWLPNGKRFKIIKSQPSVVETSFRVYFLRTLIAHILKAPWHIFRNKYHFVGGWEFFAQRKR